MKEHPSLSPGFDRTPGYWLKKNGQNRDMKATIERATLLKSLSHVQSVVERRNTIPILSNVLIEASADGAIKLMATDLDLQIVESVSAQVEQAGATTISAHTLFDIARKLPEGSQVSLHAAEGKMLIQAGRARFNLSTLPRDDFPVIAEGDLPTTFELPAETLKQIIDKTRFAISTEETRYYLNGIYFHVTDDDQPVLKAAATDGHRLARVTVTRPDGAEGMPGIIIPRKCIGELRKLLDEVEGSVGIALSASKIRFGLGSAILTSKLIDGTFPDYSRVIPTANDKLLKIDPRSFEVSTALPSPKRTLVGDSDTSAVPSTSSSSLRSSTTHFFGMITSGMPSAPSGLSTVTRASRWPSVAAAFSLSSTTWRKMPIR